MTWHTVKEAASILGLSTFTVYQLCESRRLGHRRIGLSAGKGKIQIGDGAIAAYLASCEVPAETPEERAAHKVAKGRGRPPASRAAGNDLAPNGKPYRFV